MTRSSSALAELLAGKTPEAMYDALFAGRYLSVRGKDSPHVVLDFIKAFMRSTRQRALMPPMLLPRLATALAESGLLNESGEKLASQAVTDE
jgi:hypothetical protein